MTCATGEKVDFTILLKDNKFRDEWDADCDGAAIFVKKFEGFLGRFKQRSRRETLELIVGMGLANDVDSAKEVVEELKKESHLYSAFLAPRAFYLAEFKTSQGDVSYRIVTYG